MKSINLNDEYQSALEALYAMLPAFHRVGEVAYKPGLDNTIRLLNYFENPQNSYKTIHVGGTNGKGSTSHLLASVLQESNYKVGLYTSPHLVDFGERIRINGQMIEKKYVVDFVAKHSDIFAQIKPSFFEVTMAMAFTYFAENRVDVAVIEVGMGGRLDSTNIINPDLSIITNIGLDHTQFLGDNLTKIAIEKAGIIKENRPLVVGETQPEIATIFEDTAARKNSPITFADVASPVTLEEEYLDKLRVYNPQFGQLEVGLSGQYQLKNVATVLSAISTLRKAGYSISQIALRKGLKNVVKTTLLQGRWQVVSTAPMVILDTAHNMAGISQMIPQLESVKREKLYIVIGLVKDKDAKNILQLFPTEATYYFTNPGVNRALPAEKLAQIGNSIGLSGNCYDTVNKAVSVALSVANKADLIFIGGSNFVVGDALVSLNALSNFLNY